jgi:hypothetical protein
MRLAIAIAAVAVLAGVIGVGSAAAYGPASERSAAPGLGTAIEPASRSVRHTCEFPQLGPLPVTLTVAATLPGSVTAGSTVETKDFSATVELPEPTAAALRGAGVSSVDGAARIALAAAHAGKSSDVSVGVALPPADLPQTGGALLRSAPDAARGVPPVPTTKAGQAVYTIGAPAIRLNTKQIDGLPATLGTVDLVCTQDPDQNTTLGAVDVRAKDEAPGEGAGGPGTGLPGMPSEDELRRLGTPVPGNKAMIEFRILYELTGTTTVKKLNHELTLGPGRLDALLRVDTSVPGWIGYLEGDMSLPPVRDTFTLFRFMPSDATTHFLPDGKVTGTVQSGKVFPKAKMNIKLADTTVNGVPLNLGQRCQTGVPANIDLIPDPDYNILFGGTMRASIVIPDFSGCGATEDLDPMMVGLISGPDNPVVMKIAICGAPNRPGPCPSERGATR